MTFPVGNQQYLARPAFLNVFCDIPVTWMVNSASWDHTKVHLVREQRILFHKFRIKRPTMPCDLCEGIAARLAPPTMQEAQNLPFPSL